MVRLSDERFFNEAFSPPASPELRMTASELQRLEGLGDRDLRAARELLEEHGIELDAAFESTAGVETNWAPAAGHGAEFFTPDLVRRAGVVQEIQGKNALLKLDDGEFSLVPLKALQQPTLERVGAKAKAIRAALNNKGIELRETRDIALRQGSKHDYTLSLAYSHGRTPTDEDVRAFVAAKYPEARVLDADDSRPGLLTVFVTFPEERVAQTVDTDSPPLETEEIEGTGRVARALERIAAMNPQVLFDEVAHEELPTGTRIQFEATFQDGAIRRAFIEEQNGALRGGFIAGTKEIALKAYLRTGQVEAPYSSGHGPDSTRFDDVNADLDVEGDQKPLRQREMMQMLTPQDQRNIEQQKNPVSPSPEEIAKRRRLDRNKERLIGPDQTILTASAPTQSEEDGETREHIAGPGVQIARKEAQLFGHKGDRFVVKQEVADVDGKKIPAGTTVTVEQTHVGRWNDLILSDGANQYTFEPRKFDELYVGGFFGVERGAPAGAPPAAAAPGKKSAELRKEAVDAKTKTYWETYFGEYGRALTKEVNQNVDEAPKDEESKTASIVRAFQHHAARAPSPIELYKISALLSVPFAQRAAQLEPGAFQRGNPKALADALMDAGQRDQGAQKAADKLVVDFVARNPDMLRKVSPDAYPRLLHSAIQVAARENPAMLSKMQSKVLGDSVFTPDGEQPGLLSRMRKKIMPTPQERVDSMGGQSEADAAAQAYPSAPKKPPIAEGLSRSTVRSTPPSTVPGPAATPATEKPPATPNSAPLRRSKERAGPAPEPPQGPSGTGAAGSYERGAPITIPAGARIYDVANESAMVAPVDISGSVHTDSGADIAVKDSNNHVYIVERQELMNPPSGAPAGAKRGLERLTRRKAPKQGAKPKPRKIRMPPAAANLRFQCEDARAEGDYVHFVVTWDPESLSAMSPAAGRHAVISYVKQQATEHEPQGDGIGPTVDLGIIGKPRLIECDLEAGRAEVMVRSSERRVFVPTVRSR
jgi:hypothetical protein